MFYSESSRFQYYSVQRKSYVLYRSSELSNYNLIMHNLPTYTVCAPASFYANGPLTAAHMESKTDVDAEMNYSAGQVTDS